jgi:ribosomal protein L39E
VEIPVWKAIKTESTIQDSNTMVRA